MGALLKGRFRRIRGEKHLYWDALLNVIAGDNEYRKAPAMPDEAPPRASGPDPQKPSGLRPAPTPPPRGPDPDRPRVAPDRPPPPRRARVQDEADEDEDEEGGWRSVPLVGPLLSLEPLSDAEAREYREHLIAGFTKWCEIGDELMPRLSRTHAPLTPGIWSTMSDREIAVVCDAWLDLGRQVGAVGQSVRGAVKSVGYFLALAILAPRFGQSFAYYAQEGLLLSFRVGRGRTVESQPAGAATRQPQPAGAPGQGR